jgi:hypothetical protein
MLAAEVVIQPEASPVLAAAALGCATHPGLPTLIEQRLILADFVTGMRAQFCHRAQNDFRRHQGKRHDAIQFAAGGREAAQCQFGAMVLRPRAKVANRNPYFWPGASDVARACPPHTVFAGRTLD